MDGENSKNTNDETPYACNDDISKADPGASLNEQDPVDDNIFEMDAVRAELPPPNFDKSKHVDQVKSTTKRVKRVNKSRKIKDYPEKIRTSNGYLFYDPRSNVRTMLRREQIEALKQQKESSKPAALVVTAALPSPSASA
ncbi:hypothetical protein MKW92_006951 [Papaver armeniacum]|nr:hypothetical protein MKW92_006951 [Papaver armeniacum]